MRRSKRYEPIGMTHIGTILAEAIGDEDRVRQALGVWPAWEQAVGPQIAQAARPVALRNGVLTVHVKHAVWLQELTAQRVSLLRRIGKHAPPSLVRELRFRVAVLPDLPAEREAMRARLPPPSPIPYEMARAIRRVDSPQLRSVMLRIASRLPHEE